MATNKTITINGRAYDAVTGLPISERVYDQVSRVSSPAKKSAPAEEKAQPVTEKKPVPAVKRPEATTATAVHSQTQRSKTLLRRSTKKPATPAKRPRPTSGRHMDMARSSKISKFAPHPVIAETPKPTVAAKPDKAPQVHPVAAKAVARTTAAKSVVAKPATSKQVKDAAIENALATPKAPEKKDTKQQKKVQRRLIIVASVILVIGLAFYAVYRFIPGVSVSIASTQAGVNASYPEFVPDGYSLDHPVTFSDGEVSLKFKSNSNDNSYTIKQTRSSWDSSAVLDNIVRPEAGENYITTKERGLTVYSYGNNAAWVNGGLLYEISSANAPLSGEQIRHIATSL
jgi:hypothetical protein